MKLIFAVIMMWFAVYWVLFVIIFQCLLRAHKKKARRRKDVDDTKEMIQ